MGFLRKIEPDKNFIVDGKIPEEISVYSKNYTKIVRTIGGETHTAEVIPAFICDKRSKTAHDTAKLWSGSKNCEDRPNLPMGEIQVWDLEARSKGGRAYKVITQDGLYLDMREDVFLESIISCGIDRNGKIKAEFVFAIVENQMKLVRVGSTLHTKLIEATQRKTDKPIPVKDLKVGGVYRSQSGSIEVFCGFVIDESTRKRKQFWFTILMLDDLKNTEKIQSYFDEHLKDASRQDRLGISKYDVRLRSSHTFTEFIGMIEIGDRSKYFYFEDVQNYNTWRPGTNLKYPAPIWTKKTWNFVD